MTTRSDRIEALRDLLARLDEQIGELERRLPTADAKWVSAHGAELESLKRRRHHAGGMLSELELEEAESWREEEFSASLMAIFDHLGKRLDHLLGKHPD